MPSHPLRTFLLHLRNTMHVTEIPLEPLDAAETSKLASQVAGREMEMDEGLYLYQETGGYPLFVVEMMRVSLPIPTDNAAEAKRSRVSQSERKYLGRVSEDPSEAGEYIQSQVMLDDARVLPPRVYAVLAGRLQQLSASARSFVELAAVIGREFTLDFLITITNVDADNAVRALDELWYKRIVR